MQKMVKSSTWKIHIEELIISLTCGKIIQITGKPKREYCTDKSRERIKRQLSINKKYINLMSMKQSGTVKIYLKS